MPAYPPTTSPLTPSQPISSSLVAPIPVPTHGPGGTFSILAKTTIQAPPERVLAAIRDTRTWPRWNTFCPRCVISASQSSKAGEGGVESRGSGEGREGWLSVGDRASLEVFMDGRGLEEGARKERDQGIEITRLEVLCSSSPQGSADCRRGLRIAWVMTGMSRWQLRSERVMDLLEIEGGDGGVEGGKGEGKATEYVCWETFGGVLGVVVKGLVGEKLVVRFGDYARDLKGFVEAGGA